MNDASPSPPSPRGVSMTTLILTAALTAATAAAVVLAVLYFVGDRKPGASSPSLPAVLSSLGGPSPTAFVQTDVVKPQGQGSGDVFYPIPYAAPPHLTLTAPHRIYRILKQDEYGFSWTVDSLLADFVGEITDLKDKPIEVLNATTAKKANIEYEDFSWEAKGVPAGADAGMQRPFQQTNSFQSVIGTQGQVNFEVPYASPPNVTLNGSTRTTVIVEATTTGFKWKNAGTDPFFNNGSESWTAKGVRATKLPK